MRPLHRLLAQCSVQLGIVCRCLFSLRGAPWSKLAFVAGLAYSYGWIDLIPNRLPYVGHLDEIGFALTGLMLARLMAPATLLEPGHSLAGAAPRPFGEHLRFTIRVLRADLANFFLFQHRDVHAFLITGKNSGTHWVKFMLSVAIAEQFGVAAPFYASGPAGDAIIGHPRWPSAHPGLPRIGSSHTIPSRAFAWRTRLLDHPPVVVFVRDIRQAMLSNFVKWQQHYGGTLADYVRGDPLGRRHVADVWWYVHFFNRWGDVARARPHNTLIVRYEDLQACPRYWLERIASHLRVPLDEAALAAGLRFTSREALQSRLDPTHAETIIPAVGARSAVRFSEADEHAFAAILSRHLRHRLGYDYPVRSAGRHAQERRDEALASEL